MKKIIAIALSLIMIFLMIPATSLASEETEQDFERKTLSILGDSISTYSNYSNGTASTTTNSTIKNGSIYYPRSGFDITVDDTWWKQAADFLGLDILVNNSWSGSCIFNTRQGTVGAYIDRCVQLHDDTGDNAGEAPDVIAIYLGTNDYYSFQNSVGSVEAIDFESLISEKNGVTIYSTPTTAMEAYAIMLHKIKKAYPAAELYCFTLLQRSNYSKQPTAFNADIIKIATRYGASVVDFYNCGITSEEANFNMFMGDSLHPNSAGMDAMSNAFISSFIKNSAYVTEKAHYDVTYELDNVIVMGGTTRTVFEGEAFNTTLIPNITSRGIDVKVYMGEKNITNECYENNVISISSVTDNVTIKATMTDREPYNYYWQTSDEGDSLISVSDLFYKENNLILTSGSITDGKFSGVKGVLEEEITLKHDKTWFIEWKSSGTWTDTTDGALLFASAANSTTPDVTYIYRRHNSDFIAFGTRADGKYCNYGVSLKANGIDGTVEHTYRLENRIATDGSNMVYLFVDGVEIAPMTHHWLGGTDQKTEVNWLCGRDITFTHMGTSPHTIGNCYIDYIQVSEDGKEYVNNSNLDNFYWQTNDEGDSLISVSDSFYKENNLILTSGSITDGKFSGVKGVLEEEITLKHDKPWFIEWKSSGTWTDTTDGALLFASAANSTTPDVTYIYRRHNSDFIAFGTRADGKYCNYGVSLKANGIDGTVEHTYRLANRIADDGSNMVYLFVDGVEIAPMTHHWLGGTDQKTEVNWLCGRDITFTHMGTSPHTIGNCYIDYIQVSEDGHEHTYENSVCTSCGYAPDVTEKPKSVEFYINNQAFTAIEGQTWAEWIASYGISAGDNGIVWIGYKNHPIMDEGYLYYHDEKTPLGTAIITLGDMAIRFDEVILNDRYGTIDTKSPVSCDG